MTVFVNRPIRRHDFQGRRGRKERDRTRNRILFLLSVQTLVPSSNPPSPPPISLLPEVPIPRVKQLFLVLPWTAASVLLTQYLRKLFLNCKVDRSPRSPPVVLRTTA